MNISLIVLLVLFLILGIGVLVLVLITGGSKGSEATYQAGAASDSLKKLVATQRQQSQLVQKAGSKDAALAAAMETYEPKRIASDNSKLTLEKRLRFARWKITPMQFRSIQVFATLLLFIPAYLYTKPVIWVTAIFLAWNLVNGMLNMAVHRRFKQFDMDYPVFLLQLVSMLKTGMSVMTGLENAAKALNEDSLVRAEIMLLLERLRLGLSEEQAINAFGEDIAHPEIELFVQSLLLCRRVGGTLSHTLERLAKQVRKRQQFRDQAVAAVGMERSSIYAIAVIMTLLLMYLMYAQPELIKPAWKDNMGSWVLQFGFALVLLGFYLSKIVTNIKV